MVMIGIDAHEKTFTAVTVNEVGRELGHRTFKSTSDGCFELVRWASQWPERRFAVEDCRHLTRRVEPDLLAARESLVRIHTQLMAGERRGGRERGKSDPIDALAVARVALREPDLPVARLDGPTGEIRLLTDHRQCLVRERTRLHNRLRWHLHELNPDFDVRPRGLRADKQLIRVTTELGRMDGLVAELAMDLVERCRDLNRRIRELEARLRPLSIPTVRLFSLCPGVGYFQRPRSWERPRGRSFPIPSSVRPVQRHSTRSGVVIEHRTVPTQPGRQPTSQLRPAHDRRHPTPWDWAGRGVCGQTCCHW